MAGNTALGAARAKKDNEFYTQWRDIENEVRAYLDYNPDLFKGKTLLLPCDDPAASNFTKYFALNFERLGLKKLISTSYAPKSNPAIEETGQLTLFYIEGEQEDPAYDAESHWNKGRIFTLEKDNNGDGIINKDDLTWHYLEGDGDFRSEEVTALRDEADFVITNPPFSLFREFIPWLTKAEGLQFSVIGNDNALTYKEVFPLIKSNKLWKGATANSTDMVFEVPLTSEVKQSDMDKAAKLGYPSDTKHKYTRLGNSAWFTNIQHGVRHEPLELMSMEDNLIYGSKKVKELGYPTYDNYDAIEVPETKAIPSDYEGVMGVPISFISRYNPDQFEILGATESEGKGFSDGLWDTSSKIAQACANGQRIYKRIFIKHRSENKAGE